MNREPYRKRQANDAPTILTCKKQRITDPPSQAPQVQDPKPNSTVSNGKSANARVSRWNTKNPDISKINAEKKNSSKIKINLNFLVKPKPDIKATVSRWDKNTPDRSKNNTEKETDEKNQVNLPVKSSAPCTTVRVNRWDTKSPDKSITKNNINTTLLATLAQGRLPGDTCSKSDVKQTQQAKKTALPKEFERLITYLTSDENVLVNEPLGKANLVIGAYRDIDQYLNVEFRLLEEDFATPLREAVVMYINYESDENDNDNNIKIHSHTEFLSPWWNERQIGVLVQFCKIVEGKNYNFLKRFIYGSLICFTKDNFATVIIGKVLVRDLELLKKGQVVVGFEPGFDTWELNQPYIMIESTANFESYCHISKALQEMDRTSFPMKNYLVDVNPIIEPASYLSPNTIYEIKGHKVSVLTPNSWPSAQALTLDEAQYSAFKAALTQKFTLIQGAPGTGKTHLGLEIAKTFIKNPDDHTPILVVCYTSRTLDRFLEGLADTTAEIVRVGGPTKNKNLVKYNLREQRKCGTQDNVGLEKLKKEIEDNLANMKDLRDALDEIKKFNGVVDFKPFIEVDPDLVQSWFASATDKEIIDWLFSGCTNENFQLKIQQAMREEQNWQEQQTESHKQADKELEELFEAEDVEKLEIEDDFNITETEPTKSHKPNYLITILDIIRAEQNVSMELANVNKNTEWCNVLQLEKQRRQINNDLPYLKMRLQEAKTITVTKKPENCDLHHPENIMSDNRWMLYFYWLGRYQTSLMNKLSNLQAAYHTEIRNVYDTEVMKRKLVVGMTTTGAAHFQKTFQELKCRVVIVEEAAEILESHIIVTLTNHCEHLILIGDHQQTRPSIIDYHIEYNYHLGLSLFERMVCNDMPYHVLNVQHRMRPEITKLIMPSIYPTLGNHLSVCNFPTVLGTDSSVYFINHNQPDDESSEINKHEVTFLINLAQYLIQNGYKPEDITILAAHSGQMLAFWKELKQITLLQNLCVTCLDNYQGKENKIILLSLTGYNKEDKIGFLKTENWIRVALTRAKEGFYMIGNMDLLSQENEIWSKLKSSLISQNCFGEALPLRCQIHKEIVTKVESGEGFLKYPEGGCNKICKKKLKCGHICPKICHITDKEHEAFQCEEKCIVSCRNNHKHNVMCYLKSEDTKDYKCRISVKCKLPCGHEISKLCFEDRDTFKCLFSCKKILKQCGHMCKLPCHTRSDSDPSKCDCQKLCTKPASNCSMGTHKCQGKCSEVCPPCGISVLKKRTICFHTFEVACSVDINKVACNIKMERKRPGCSHKITVPCGTNMNEVACDTPCDKTLPCGHKCKMKCSESCGNCQEIVKKSAACGHSAMQKCCEESHCKICESPCSRMLSCGHRCQNKSNEACTVRCTALVEHTKVAACGHKFKIECHLLKTEFASNSQNFLKFCREPCGGRLECSHPCPGTCGECVQGRFHQNCKQKCTARLICGHECHMPCGETCSPCNQKCPYKCKHRKCEKMCGEAPCTKCFANCERQCIHIKCKAKCWKICPVPPCTNPCRKRLPCDHKCIGFCSDPCPKLCRICNKKELSELLPQNKDLNAVRFVLLDECGHVIEHHQMEQWLQKDKLGCKTCPKCKTPLASTQRYSDYIKRSMKDVIAIKKQFYGGEAENKFKQTQLLAKVELLQKKCSLLCKHSPPFAEILRDLRTELKQEFKFEWTFLLRTVTSIIQILEDIAETFNKANLKYSKPIQKATAYINFLVEVLSKKKQQISNQEIADFERELRRLTRIVQLCQIEHHTNFQTAINTLVFSCKVYMDDLDAVLKYKLNSVNKQINGKIVISDNKRGEIVRAIGMGKGQWCRCTKGHYCRISETGRCNQCGCDTSRKLVLGNKQPDKMEVIVIDDDDEVVICDETTSKVTNHKMAPNKQIDEVKGDDSNKPKATVDTSCKSSGSQFVDDFAFVDDPGYADDPAFVDSSNVATNSFKYDGNLIRLK